MTSNQNPKSPIFQSGNAPFKPAVPPSNLDVKMAPVAPDVARQTIESRVLPEVTSDVVEGALSIVELARALQGTQTLPFSPQLFYQFVYDNVDFVTGYGVAKGSLGTLLDGCGNPFDQCCLLAALLRQVGFTVNYEVGNILLTVAQACAWLGVTDGSISTAESVLSNAGVPVSTSSGELVIGHCWLKVNIGTVESPDWVVMDPSYKTFATTTGINLTTATGYSQATFLSDARSGYTIDGSGNWVENVNCTNIRNDLQSYANNLVSWIRTNNPTATMDEIIGGREIIPITLPVTFPASLPYENPGDVPVEFTGDFSNAYKVTIEMIFPGFDITLTSDQVYGHRLTWFYTETGDNVFTPTLALDGVTQATGTAQGGGTWYSMEFIVNHNAYPTTGSNQTFYQALYAPNQDGTGQQAYLIGTSFGPAGKGLIDYHEALALQNRFNSSVVFNEPALGENLAFQWANYCAQVARVGNILNKLTSTIFYNHHTIGTASFQDYGPPTFSAFDIQGVVGSGALLNGSVTNYDAAGINNGMHGYATEMLAIQQLTGQPGWSETRDLDIANSAGTKIYKATPTTWSTISTEDLSGYSETDISNIYNGYVYYGADILLAQSTGQVFGSATLYGWAAIYSSGAAGIIYSTYAGGGGPGDPTPMPPPRCHDCEDDDPVDIRTGDYRYRHEDLTIGSEKFPYSLSFQSSYDSRARLINGPLGLGWTHNWNTSAHIGSDGLRGLGSDSPISAAASIAELFVTLDILGDTTLPVDKLVMASVANQWWVDQMTNNVVVLSLPDNRDLFYVLLADGSYNPPVQDASTLTLSAGVYTHTTPQKVVSTFNTSGKLATIAFPSGVVITLTYTSGNLTSITNGMGRTLTLGYTGTFITSVSDGTGRSAGYTITSNQLTEFTDALSQTYTFAYVTPGSMYQYFKPQNPSNACVTNTYDSLNRIESQIDILGHPFTFYLAGSRSESIDSVGNASVTYFDSNNDPITYIDALSNVTTRQFDGLGRTIQVTQPEGNYTAWTYDQYNNILTATMVAKSGSGLANIVLTNTYNSAWNKVATAKDGNLNTTTNTYDPSTGNLIEIQQPTLTAGTPTARFTWNGRGQKLSSYDQTGLQTQFVYDASTEKMTSMVVNTDWSATIGGIVGVGDVLTLIAHDPALSGGQESVSYTVVTGDNLSKIATGLAAAVIADSHLSAIGIFAYSSGAVVSLGTAAGNTTTWTKTTPGTETITLAAGFNLTTDYGYDTVGNTNSVEDPRSNTTSFLFDNLRRLTLRTEAAPFSYETQYGYDANSNLLTLQRQTGIPATPWQIYAWTYSLSDKRATLTDPANNVTHWSYDGADRLQTIGDAQGQTYQIAYDQLNRVYTVTDPTLVVTDTRGYSPNRKLISLMDAASNTTTFTFDGFDRPNKTIYPDGTYEQDLLYDDNGNVLTYVTRLGTTVGEIALTYDALNRLSTRAPYGQATETYGYDLAGRLLSIVDSILGTFQRQYDTAGRFYQEIYPSTSLQTVTLTLDANSNVIQIVYPDGYYVQRAYDQLNRLTTITLNGATEAAATYSYDELSRRSSLILGSGGSVTYGFQLNEDLASLTNTMSGSSLDQLFEFNKVHQIASQYFTDSTYSWAPGTLSDTYSPANNLNQYPAVAGTAYSYNQNGCLTSDGVFAYGYNTQNELTSASKTGLSMTYQYDGDHRQIYKTNITTGVETLFIYSGWQRIADYSVSGTTETLQNRYVYGINLDEPLIQVSNTGTLTFFHANHQGSIIATTDSGGNITNKFTYGPFGETAAVSGSCFGFTGQRFDPETGLYYYKMRHYSPTLGRFLQPDPVSYLVNLTPALSLRPARPVAAGWPQSSPGFDLQVDRYLSPASCCEACDCSCTASGSGFTGGGCGCSTASPRGDVMGSFVYSAFSPSELNLYTYVANDPLNSVDPFGLQDPNRTSLCAALLAIRLAFCAELFWCPPLMEACIAEAASEFMMCVVGWIYYNPYSSGPNLTPRFR